MQTGRITTLTVLLLVSLAACSTARGQTQSSAGRDHHFSYMFGVPLLTVSYMDRISERCHMRYGVGLGDDWLFSVILRAGDHYRHGSGYFPSNPKGFSKETLLGIMHGMIAVRYEHSPHLSFDAGFLAAYFVHGDHEDDDGAPASSIGGFASLAFGKERLKFAPRIEVGYISGCAPAGEFLVRLVPLIVRFDRTP